MEIQKFDSDEVKVSLGERLSNWPTKAAQMIFDINRATGGLTLTFQGSEHAAQGLKWSEVISQEVGHCTKAAPAF